MTGWASWDFAAAVRQSPIRNLVASSVSKSKVASEENLTLKVALQPL